MSMKRHALVQTSLFITKAVEAFKHHPTATNFAILHHGMLAHQFASTEKEAVIIAALVGKKTEEIVNTLAMEQQLGIDLLNKEVEAGRARVITESYFRRPAASNPEIITESMIGETMERSR